MDIQKLKRITVVYFGNAVLFVGGKNKNIVLLYVVDAAGRGVFSASGFEQHYLELQMPMLQNRTVKRLNRVVPQLEQKPRPVVFRYEGFPYHLRTVPFVI